jgi:diaminopimelate epimerase
MEINFYKYQGTGNDFIMINNTSGEVKLSDKQVVALCDRRFGIGSDGLILLNKHPEHQFEMDFYNPDASKSFCGNGSRCAVAFAHYLGLIKEDCSFMAIDGAHKAKIDASKNWVQVKMLEAGLPQIFEEDLFLYTGSPHYLKFCDNVDEVSLLAEGSKIRYSEPFKPAGTNVNFVELISNAIKIRTYERGVENETLSCGTGVTAAALGSAYKHKLNSPIKVQARGGELLVSFKFNSKTQKFEDIWLQGEAKQVFKGKISIG